MKKLSNFNKIWFAMKKIYLIRHAQSESNAAINIRPNPQINLTPLGKNQAEILSHWLLHHITEPIEEIFVSNYVRTQQTAEPFLNEVKRQASILEDLHEFDYLDFHHIKDLSFAQLKQKTDDFWQVNDIYHKDSQNTESFWSFAGRVMNARAYFDGLNAGTYVVFGHGMWLGMLIWQLLHGDGSRVMDMERFRTFELSIRPKNTEIYLLTLDGKASITKVRVRGDE